MNKVTTADELNLSVCVWWECLFHDEEEQFFFFTWECKYKYKNIWQVYKQIKGYFVLQVHSKCSGGSFV